MAGSVDPTTFQHIYEFNGKPDTAPPDIGVHGVDIVNKKAYFSIGTTSPFEWIEVLTGRNETPVIKIYPESFDGSLDMRTLFDKTCVFATTWPRTVQYYEATFADLDLTLEEQEYYVGRSIQFVVDNTSIKLYPTDKMHFISRYGKNDFFDLTDLQLFEMRLVEYVDSSNYTFYITGASFYSNE